MRVFTVKVILHQFWVKKSGGQKRKLSVGIALIAGSKVMRLITLELFRQCGSFWFSTNNIKDEIFK
jgi:hypothetical protein